MIVFNTVADDSFPIAPSAAGIIFDNFQYRMALGTSFDERSPAWTNLVRPLPKMQFKRNRNKQKTLIR